MHGHLLNGIDNIIDDVEFASSGDLVIAWWGSGKLPLGHILNLDPDIDTLVCHPQDENTIIATQPTGWMKILLKPKPKFVVDVYSISGIYHT